MANTVTQNILPVYSTDTGSAVAGGIQGMLGDSGYLNNLMSNWYSQSPTQGALGQYAQYNQSTADQFMNPYISNVIDANTQQSNQNLLENVLPGVNSTFTGAGQFGSTRNSDFTERAIRNNQQTLANTNATSLYNAQNSALTNYQNWTQMGINAGQQDYTNWYQRVNYPVSALSSLAAAAKTIDTSGPLATVNGTADASDINNWVTALGAASNASQDWTLDWLAGLWR